MEVLFRTGANMRYNEFRIVESQDGLESGPPYPPEDMDAVRELQTKLRDLGYSVGATGIDGKYGPRTTAAVRAFKRDNNISGDGLSISAEEIERLDNARRVAPTQGSNSSRGSTLPEPEGGSQGQLRLNTGMGPLIDLDGSESRLTSRNAGRAMQATIRRARRMAEIFGKPITINDAIAKRGTSRENETPGSQHFHGNALDLNTAGMTDQEKLELVSAALEAGFTGFGFGQNILHVDTGPRRHWAYGNNTYGGQRIASLGSAVRNYNAGTTGVA